MRLFIIVAALSTTAFALDPVTIDVSATDAGAFNPIWRVAFGSGHAALTLRPDWRAQVTQAQRDLGVFGLRYHGLFDDDMAVVTSLVPPTYNFTLIQSTWDFFAEVGISPIVELSFMPCLLANCTWRGSVNPGHAPCKTIMAYQGVTMPPTSYELWYDLVHATVSMAVARYGLTTVQKWTFECWNELWGMAFPADYMPLYNASVMAIKNVHPSLRVGGPATAALENVADFAAYCRSNNIPFDFVSTHHYPTDSPLCPQGAGFDPTCFTRNVLAARNTVAGEPFYLTEYSVGVGTDYPQHDWPGAAAFVFRQVGELNQHLDALSYWTFSDVFEEGGLPTHEFQNLYGAMTIHGVAKPVWRAFQLMQNLTSARQLAVTVANPDPLPYVSAFATAPSAGDLSSLAVFVGFWFFGDASAPPTNKTVTVTVAHSADSTPPATARLYLLDNTHANPRAAWEAMGSPAVPSPAQLAALTAASLVPAPIPVPVTVLTPGASVAVTLPGNMAPNTAAVLVF